MKFARSDLIEPPLRKVLLAVVLLAALAPAAQAGVADSPLPELVPGETTYHLYSVPGVIQVGYLGTFFSCTSLDTVTMQVSVEGFGSFGGASETDAVASALSVGPGATVVFATQAAQGIPVNTIIGFTSSRGSARVLATSKKLACTAFVADRTNDLPQTSWQLTIIAKTKQKAAN